MRVVHYLNQFFGGIGAEEQAGIGLEARDGAVGPGKLLEQLLGDGAQIVMTLVCGDNYAVEHEEELGCLRSRKSSRRRCRSIRRRTVLRSRPLWNGGWRPLCC